MGYAEMTKLGLADQIEQLRARWPQANAEGPNKNGEYLILVPGMLLPKGWNKTICTAMFLTRINGAHAGPLDGFCVDLPDLRLEGGAHPHYSRPFALAVQERYWHEPTQRYWGGNEQLPGFPQWKDLTRFWWRSQSHDPNHHRLFTTAMMIKQRLNPAR